MNTKEKIYRVLRLAHYHIINGRLITNHTKSSIFYAFLFRLSKRKHACPPSQKIGYFNTFLYTLYRRRI